MPYVSGKPPTPAKAKWFWMKRYFVLDFGWVLTKVLSESCSAVTLMQKATGAFFFASHVRVEIAKKERKKTHL
jgi:hypothetical protein